MEAVIQGEVHSSEKDREALLKEDLSEYDAVFREGYDKNYSERKITALYGLFAIGHLVYGSVFGRFYDPIEELKQDAEEKEVPLYDEIDAAIYETYEMVSDKWKALCLFLSPFLAAFIIGIISGPVILGYRYLPVEAARMVVRVWTVLLMLFTGFAWAFSFFFLIDGSATGGRDVYMAEQIIEKAEEKGYQRVLVSCGDSHRPGIASYLRDEGWSIEEEPTESLLGKVLILHRRFLKAIFNPIESIRKVVQRTR